MSRSAAVTARIADLQAGLRDLEKLLVRLPDPPEPLTSAELAARAHLPRSGGAPGPGVPAPPPSRPPGSLAAAAAALSAGEVSAAELVGDALDRAEAASGLGVFIRLFPEALDEARRADEAGGREADQPLSGIPLSVKDIVDVEGLTTTSGSRFPRQPVRSAPVWRRLADAGAILLGKANLQEFAFGVSGDNPTFGRVRNPHAPDRIPGGSSSGSAASLAAGIGYGSVGTDTGGSIRIPASLTGIFGLKPSYGRVSRAGVTPLSWSLDHVGPMARSAVDIAILWGALSGPEAGDSIPSDASAGSESHPLSGVRLGIPQGLFRTNLAPEADLAADRAAAVLAGLGAEPVEVEIPEVELAGLSRNTLAFSEAAAVHRERLLARPGDISPAVRELLEVGAGLATGDLITALRGRRLVTDACSALLDRVEALLLPTTPTGAPVFGEPRLENGEDLRPGLIRLVGPFNLTGLPALSCPAGRDAHGMPLGVQLVGRHGGERTVIRLARFLEAAGEFSRPPVRRRPPD